METRADRLFVSADWKQWIAENLLRGAPRDELVEVLVRDGFGVELARLEVDAAAEHPYLAAAQTLGRQVLKRDWFSHTQRIMQRELGRSKIERRAGLAGDDFHRDYCALNRPVILTDAVSDWPAMQNWTPEFLQERCGSQRVEIQARRESNTGYEIDKDAHRYTCEFGEFVRKVFFGGSSNDYYMTAGNASANRYVLQALWDDIVMPPELTEDAGAQDRTFFWLGPAGTVTPLHHDLTNNFMAQVCGRKRVRMISPANTPLLYNQRHCFSRVDIDSVDEQEFPLFRDAHIYDVELQPGELLFLPVGWWHHVIALDVSITVTFTNFRSTNDFTSFYSTYGEI